MAELPLLELDESAVRAWATSALLELSAARDEIDALNVYPVPDGDTGTNLYLTFQAAIDDIDAVPEGSGPRPVLDAMARGALLGARGNSGAILSQALRGLAEVLDGSAADASTLATGLMRAADAAYGAVANPVEGTMLTVLRAAADAAAAPDIPELAELVASAASCARAALARTPEQLDVLREAGVVDAGGRGICVLLDVLERIVVGSSPGLGATAQLTAAPPSSLTPAGAASPAYEVMFLLDAPGESMPSLRGALTALGDSLVLAGDDRTWNVHVHVDDVGAAIEAALSAGRPRDIRVTDLREAEAEDLPPDRERAVVVVGGAGLGGLFEAAGATVAVGASQPVNEAELSSALVTVGAREIIVVPTDEDGYELARVTAGEHRRVRRPIEVVPVRASVQALSALTAHDPLARFEDDLLQMTAAASRCRHGAVEVASEERVTSAGACRPGDVLGSIDAEVVVVGRSATQVACEVVDRLLAAGGVALSLVVGEDATGEMTTTVLEHVRNTHPDLEIVTRDAPHSSVLLVGVE